LDDDDDDNDDDKGRAVIDHNYTLTNTIFVLRVARTAYLITSNSEIIYTS
jgi:hypothetical protein